ncbi:MAG: response regulator transcription factor [Chitinophagaceae bacterium]|nr:response regulator transcription factor [Chitinophagaceae bacterium]
METVKSKILLVEDDTNFGEVLKKYLELNNYFVVLARDGILGLASFREERFDLCILDVMMPNMDGFTLADEIRKLDAEIPLFFLTAKGSKDDMLTGYNLGADDYLTKPFDSEILLHKIKAMIKRNSESLNALSDVTKFTLGKYEYDSALHQLVIEGRLIQLSPKENSLLQVLCEKMNDLLTREEALKRVWGSDTYFNGRSMDVFIGRLRKYLKEDESVNIVTHSRLGFRLMVPEAQPAN